MSTWNPIRINFMHLWLLVRDAWRAGSWRDKLRIWFMPTGWRPADVDIHYPVNKIEDVYNFERYAPPVSGPLKAWSGIQMAAVFIFVMYMFGNLAVIGSPGIFLYGAFIFLSVHAYTELMDRNRYAIWWELLKNSYGLALILSSGDWFGLNSFIPGGAVAVSVWFAVTTLVTWWFVVRETEKNVPELQL
jgi:alkylglycerol monooxygenase